MSAWRAVWDRMTLYLPMLLMGLMALGTYWLVRSTPAFEVTVTDQPPRHEPDYFLHKFSVKTFDEQGRLKSEVLGEQARHFPDTDTLEIEQVRIRNFNAQGQLTVATARRALANADASEVQLMGGARVVREAGLSRSGEPLPRMSYSGEFLHAFMDTERVRSHLPVELVRGKDRFTAESMDFDNVEQTLQLRGRVRGVLVPEPEKPARP